MKNLILVRPEATRQGLASGEKQQGLKQREPGEGVVSQKKRTKSEETGHQE